jgi:hypothetical protein
MADGAVRLLQSGAAALVFAAAFVFGGRVHPLRGLIPDRRSTISAFGGMAAAYVFVHVMPELSGARRALVESASMPLRFEGMAIYFVALTGFLLFYGMDHLRARLSGSEEADAGRRAFTFHVGGFAAYAALMAYLLVHSLEESSASLALYTLSIGVHFLALDHSLDHEHGAAYRRTGRFVLAGACLAGWAAGALIALPHAALALLVAFVSGAIVMNSLVMELPSERDGRFLPFLTGGIVYGLVLVPLG